MRGGVYINYEECHWDTMRALAAADLHGKAERFHRLQASARRYNPDLIVLAGDITSYIGGREVLPLIADMVPPVLAVRGNSDVPSVAREMERVGIKHLHLGAWDFKGSRFVGVSGAVPIPFWTKFSLREGWIDAGMARLIDSETIVVAHSPPRGARDEVFGTMHAGSSLLRRWMDERRPKAVICGHIHERTGYEKAGETLVINCSIGKGGSGTLIETRKDREPKIKVLD